MPNGPLEKIWVDEIDFADVAKARLSGPGESAGDPGSPKFGQGDGESSKAEGTRAEGSGV